MSRGVQLIAYANRFGGDLKRLEALLAGPLEGLFQGLHVLPFYYPVDGSDAGFDPIDHSRVDPSLGGWDDIASLAQTLPLMADLIVNHVSSHSEAFQSVRQEGQASSFWPLFLTMARIFPTGATESDLLQIKRPRPSLPFTRITLENGSSRLFWTTFSSHQIDIDVESSLAGDYLAEVLDQLKAAGIRWVRLDAVGYAIKRAGSSCFLLPETYRFISWLSQEVRARGMEALVECHANPDDLIELAAVTDWVYDFALPPLILHTLFKSDCNALVKWLEIMPHNCVTVLDTHDGIGIADIRGDEEADGLLSAAEIDELVEEIHRRTGGQSRAATGEGARNVDIYQVNTTYFDALGKSATDYLIARAIQLFAPGIAQIYYVGLLAGSNDMTLLAQTGVGRDINRHVYSPKEIDAALERPLVGQLLELIRLCNSASAFQGRFNIEQSGSESFEIGWEHQGNRAILAVDAAQHTASICVLEENEERTLNLA